MFVVYACILLFMIHQSTCAMKATVVLYQTNSNTTSGTLTFIQDNANAPVSITGSISGLNISAAHGFHVHTNAVSESFPNCSSAGVHFNPYNTPHGPLTANIANRHVGDLGNLISNSVGMVTVNITDFIIQLINTTQSIINRTVMIHSGRDDEGLGSNNNSNINGNAGVGIICGLIKLSEDTSNTTTTMMGASNTTTMMTSVSNNATTTMGASSTTTMRTISTTITTTATVTTSTTTRSTTTSAATLNTKSTALILSMTLTFVCIFSY